MKLAGYLLTDKEITFFQGVLDYFNGNINREFFSFGDLKVPNSCWNSESFVWFDRVECLLSQNVLREEKGSVGQNNKYFKGSFYESFENKFKEETSTFTALVRDGKVVEPKQPERICGNCEYFREISLECRRRSPVVASDDKTVYPTALTHGWCGECQIKHELQKY